MVLKAHFSGVLSSIGTENASETRFQTPKLDHTNAPIQSTDISQIIGVLLSEDALPVIMGDFCEAARLDTCSFTYSGSA